MSNRRFYELADQIDEIISRDSPETDITRLSDLLSDQAVCRYFFQKVSRRQIG